MRARGRALELPEAESSVRHTQYRPFSGTTGKQNSRRLLETFRTTSEAIRWGLRESERSSATLTGVVCMVFKITLVRHLALAYARRNGHGRGLRRRSLPVQAGPRMPPDKTGIAREMLRKEHY